MSELQKKCKICDIIKDFQFTHFLIVNIYRHLNHELVDIKTRYKKNWHSLLRLTFEIEFQQT